MDGLECNEIPYSMLFPDNIIFRLDSEFYNNKAISVDSKLKAMAHFYLKQDEVVSGPFGSSLKSDAYLTKGEIPFVRIENIRGGFDINLDNIIYISSKDNNRIKNSQLQVDDVVLSKVGNSIGFFARVDESIGVCNISENNIGIKLGKYSTIEKHYILTYLNCRYAQMLVLRRTSGNAQPKLNVGDLCYVPIPQFTNRFYESISKIILQSKSLVLQSKKLYSSAEIIFKNKFHVEQNNAPAAIKSLSESFKKTGRLDAEYYQSKYDSLFDSLRKVDCKPLGGESGLVHMKKSIEPGSEAYQEDGIPFVRVSDVSKYEITSPEIYLSHDAVENAESLFPKKDTILFSKDGSVGIAYKLERDEDIITSGALLHLTVRNTNEILPDYLTLVLNSPVVQMQAERDSNGAIIQHWKPSEIENVIIPVLDMSKQKEIAAKVQESFSLRRKSKQLLEYAKQAVEMAIEQGEDAALTWLKDKVNQ